MQENTTECSHVLSKITAELSQNMTNFDDKWSEDERIQIRKHHDILKIIRVACVLLTFNQSVAFPCCTFTAIWQKQLPLISTKDNFGNISCVHMCQLCEIVAARQLICLQCRYYKLLHRISFKWKTFTKTYVNIRCAVCTLECSTQMIMIFMMLTHVNIKLILLIVLGAFECPYTKLKDMIVFYCNIVWANK